MIQPARSPAAPELGLEEATEDGFLRGRDEERRDQGADDDSRALGRGEYSPGKPPSATSEADDGLHRDNRREQAEQHLTSKAARLPRCHHARNCSMRPREPQRDERGQQERPVHRAMKRHPAMQRRNRSTDRPPSRHRESAKKKSSRTGPRAFAGSIGRRGIGLVLATIFRATSKNRDRLRLYRLDRYRRPNPGGSAARLSSKAVIIAELGAAVGNVCRSRRSQSEGAAKSNGGGGRGDPTIAG